MSQQKPIETHVVQSNVQLIPQVKNVIAIASGKGGVGKSTTAVNLALALKATGANVGILDGDIYGPNQGQMLGVNGVQSGLKSELGIKPVLAHGIQSISMAYLIGAATPMIWRGPMVSQALQQLARETQWRDLDYLVIDLPPGTGDIQLTLAQKIPVTGVVIVTTPQEIALLDARKALAMFRKVNVKVLGIVENMSMHVCQKCGHQEALFGTDGAQRLANEMETELLGKLPLDITIRQHADEGKPIVLFAPESSITQIYCQIAQRIASKIALLPKNYGSKFPKIVVEA
jgi:ATP-binding protein involved in chromosome partitioning